VRLFRNIKTALSRTPLLASVLVIGLALAPAMPLFAAESQPQAQPAAAAPCNVIPLEHLMPFYQNLKGANVYIDFPRGLQEAIECRDHEEECAKRDATPHAKDIDQYIALKTNSLKTLNQGFPEILYRDNLAATLRSMVKKNLAPALPHDSACQVPEPTMLDPYSRYTYGSTGPDVFNVILSITPITRTQPHIVVLTLTIDRHGDVAVFHHRPSSTAIPLNLSADEIAASFNAFLGNGGAFSPGESGGY